jgi:hypothetical protein
VNDSRHEDACECICHRMEEVVHFMACCYPCGACELSVPLAKFKQHRERYHPSQPMPAVLFRGEKLTAEETESFYGEKLTPEEIVASKSVPRDGKPAIKFRGRRG